MGNRWFGWLKWVRWPWMSKKRHEAILKEMGIFKYPAKLCGKGTGRYVTSEVKDVQEYLEKQPAGEILTIEEATEQAEKWAKGGSYILKQTGTGTVTVKEIAESDWFVELAKENVIVLHLVEMRDEMEPDEWVKELITMLCRSNAELIKKAAEYYQALGRPC